MAPAAPTAYQIIWRTQSWLYQTAAAADSLTIVALYTKAMPRSIRQQTAAICSFSMRAFGSVNRESNMPKNGVLEWWRFGVVSPGLHCDLSRVCHRYGFRCPHLFTLLDRGINLRR